MKKVFVLFSAILLSLSAFAQSETPEYGYKLTGFASQPKFGAFIIGTYKYSAPKKRPNVSTSAVCWNPR